MMKSAKKIIIYKGGKSHWGEVAVHVERSEKASLKRDIPAKNKEEKAMQISRDGKFQAE